MTKPYNVTAELRHSIRWNRALLFVVGISGKLLVWGTLLASFAATVFAAVKSDNEGQTGQIVAFLKANPIWVVIVPALPGLCTTALQTFSFKENAALYSKRLT